LRCCGLEGFGLKRLVLKYSVANAWSSCMSSTTLPLSFILACEAELCPRQGCDSFAKPSKAKSWVHDS